jgi:hypothetical protein
VRVLCVDDLFLSSKRLREAIIKEMGGDFGPVREAAWAGEPTEDQHHLQQVRSKTARRPCRSRRRSSRPSATPMS